MRKVSGILAAFFSVMMITPAWGAQWVQSGNDWHYVEEDGTKQRNTCSEDGYYLDNQGKCVALKTRDARETDREKSSNMFIKYLETGDAKYLRGSDGITIPEPKSLGTIVGVNSKEIFQSEYVDYLSCIGGKLYFRPSNFMLFNKLGFDPGTSYPDYKIDIARSLAESDPRKALDENNVPLYYSFWGTLKERGDFKPITSAKNKGIQVHEVVYGTAQPQTFYMITQRDAYKVYKEFIDKATAGTENMSERQLAEYLANVVMDYLSYSDTIANEVKQRTAANRTDNIIVTILAGTGVCSDYVDLYKYLCDITGLECAKETDPYYDGFGHGWNLVKVDGIWYHVDTTWADQNSEYRGLMGECHIKGSNCSLKTGKNPSAPWWM